MKTNSSIIKMFIGLVLFLTWVVLVVFKISGADDLITTIKFALAGLGAYHLNDRDPPPPGQVAPLSNQAGFANLRLLLTIVMVSVALLSLSGCASWLQAASAYNTSGMVSARAAEDLNVKVWTENACATPLSTIMRHPEIAGGLKALCLSSSTGSANDVLAAIPATAPAAPTDNTVPAK
jgi:hypothetical protein